MFRTQSKVEKGRVVAHEGAESGVEKIHTLIDKVAERAEVGSEKASVAGAAAAARGQELKAQAADARKQARKDAKKKLDAIDEKMTQFRNLIDRIDQALAAPDAFTRDPAKAQQLAQQRSDLERAVLQLEEDWLLLSEEIETA